MEILLYTLAALVVALIVVVTLLWVRLENARNEISDMRYVMVERDEEGNLILKNRKGEEIFEL